MAAHSSALQQCFNEVADSAPMALERCLDHVVSVLREAEGASTRMAERSELGDAWRELLKHQATWCKRYPDELRLAIEASSNKQPAERPAAVAGGFELTLVDDDRIVEQIESSRLVQHVMPLVEQPVSELDALVSSAMGLETVRPELNPVRPEVFAQTLRTLISSAQVKPATGTLWLKYMAEPLGYELQQLYGRLVVQLRDANVQAAGYHVTAARKGAANANPGRAAGMDQPGATAAQAQHPLPAAYGNLSSRQISHALLSDFLRHGVGDDAARALPISYYAEVDRELASLKAQAEELQDVAPPQLPQGYQALAPVDRPARAVGVQSALDAQVWGEYAHSYERSMVRARLRKDAKQVAQVLGLELVRKVVDGVARDPRLLTPVREAIVALEPALLRLAMVDPRFFSEEQHPGRLLMEHVAQRSFKYNDEFGAEFKTFYLGVSECFIGLNQAAIDNVKPFEVALAQLEAGWAEQDKLDLNPRDHAVEAMRFAERRQAEADQIAWELSSRPDLQGVPAVVQDFLFGPWSLVLAHAHLTDTRDQIDPHGYRTLISDLLWSVKPEVTLRQPVQLMERVPRLVGSLRAGLASIGQQRDESEPFFQALMKLHRPVLKLRRAKLRRDALESGAAPLTALDDPVFAPPAEGTKKPAVGQPWMSPRELNAAGFEETLPTDMAQLYAEESESQPAPLEAPMPSRPAPLEAAPRAKPARATPAQPKPPLSAAEVDAVIALLREGDWIDLYSKRRWLRAQLIWASTKGTLFMFVSHGGQPHSMTKRICERLIREHYVRPVHAHSVVAKALDALDQEAAASRVQAA
ncbi:MAG: DUF1631 family protein [Ramlibacter sp.]